jgi:hypothetical protein
MKFDDYDATIITGNYAHMTWRAKFWLFVDQPSPDACWEWQGKRYQNGYGCFAKQDRGELAHRVAYRLEVGDPGQLMVCHRCDNRSCVNPRHLFLGTARDNILDAAKKHRLRPARGEQAGKSKLSTDDVQQIRRLYAAGVCKQRELAERYSVSTKQVSVIVNRKQWAHLR